MDALTLVLSDPPHGPVDLEATSTLLGLGVPGTRLKVAFPAPEVLSASDVAEASEFARALRAAGLNVALLPGNRLVGLPWPSPVSSLVFDAHGLTADVREGTVHIPYDASVIGVYCKPPSDFSMTSGVRASDAMARGDGPAIAEAIQWMANLDLYFTESGVLRRISVVPDLADFSSLGPLRRPSSAENMAVVIDQCRNRFQHLSLDTRHEDVRPRQRFIMGDAGFDPDQRKRYSFGTLLLCHILDSIAPELRDIPQFELGSRVAYALNTLEA
jgi:hypothetical protein